MKNRPDGFLAEDKISHVSEIFDYVRELHLYLWRVVLIECEHCDAEYTEDEFEKLEVAGHNICWNFDYKKCKECGREITPIVLVHT